MTFDEANVGDRIASGLVPDEEMRVLRKDEMVIALERIGHPHIMANSFYASEFNAAKFDLVVPAVKARASGRS